MIRLTIAALLVAGSVSIAHAGEQSRVATLYKNPQCSCCEGYAEYLRENGYTVIVKPTHNLSLIKREHDVPAKFDGCHTTLIDQYVVEGHVPVATLNRLLSDKPNIRGISLPGMPAGSPGMSGVKRKPFVIYEISEGSEKVYGRE